ncbi:hypothetical protein ACHWQZ_G004659 [Mnemiopsis leidyi]
MLPAICLLLLFCPLSAVHTNNWVVIADASRYWFNYRHAANALSIYYSVKRLGIPDSHIILMLSDDMACNPRNPTSAQVFNNRDRHVQIYPDDVEVDYRDSEVTVENFFRVLTDRLPEGTPSSKRLMSDENSNILVYLTGHGGDGFLKFQDTEEMNALELSDVFQQMHEKKRYNELFFMIDTCQAGSMVLPIKSPNIIGVGSSTVGQDSLSHHGDHEIGVYVIDRFTYFTLDFLEKVQPNSRATLNDLFRVYSTAEIRSTPQYSNFNLFKTRRPGDVLITDFFGSVRQTVLFDEQIAPLNRTVLANNLNPNEQNLDLQLDSVPQLPF